MPYCTHCGREVGEGVSSCPDCGRGLQPAPAAASRQMPAGGDGARLAGWVLAIVGSAVMIIAGTQMVSVDRFGPVVGDFYKAVGFGFIGLGLFGVGIALLVFTSRAR